MRLFASVLACAAILAAPAHGAGAGAAHEIYVTNEISGDLTIIDGGSLRVLATIPLGKRPRGVEPTHDRRSLYVALSGSPIAGPPGAAGAEVSLPAADKAADGIGQFDIATRKLSRVLRGISDPEKLALSPDGKRLYVASEDTGTAIVLDAASGAIVATIPVGAEPEGIRTSPDGRHVYVTSEAARQVSIIDTAALRVVAQLPVGARPRSIAFSSDGARAFVPGEFDATITVIDARKLVVERIVQLADKSARPMDALVSNDGRMLYVSTGRGGTVLQLDARSGALLHSARVGTRPWGLALSPDGRRVYAANGPSNDISVIDAATFAVTATIAVGKGPWGIAVAAPVAR